MQSHTRHEYYYYKQETLSHLEVYCLERNKPLGYFLLDNQGGYDTILS